MKICYLTHVDWNWIKQRPQFIAEGLSHHHEVDYYYFPSRATRSRRGGEVGPSIRKFPIWKLPLSGRVAALANLQRGMNAFRIRMRTHDMAWVCSPEVLLRVSLADLPGTIVYDCMDDMIEQHGLPRFRELLLAHEKALLASASAVFVSSNRLRETMIRRGCAEDKLTVVLNATNTRSLLGDGGPLPRSREDDHFNIVYFGTIGRWIDLDMLHALLDDEALTRVRVTLIGPSEVPLKAHERLSHLGPVAHGELRALSAAADLFILPFRLNETTLSVDPVKLYEYIAMHRNVAARRYPEIERYSEFVRFYDDYRGLKAIILELMADRQLRYDPARADAFCAANTWEARVTAIEHRLSMVVSASGRRAGALS